MIPLDKLRPGLLALAEISHTPMDAATERLWAYATRELTEGQWKHGVDVTLRTWKSTWMPPPGVVIEAAYTAPLPPQRALPLRRGESQWADEEQRERFERAVHDNPREPEETAMDYVVRITAAALAEPASAAREPGEDG